MSHADFRDCNARAGKFCLGGGAGIGSGAVDAGKSISGRLMGSVVMDVHSPATGAHGAHIEVYRPGSLRNLKPARQWQVSPDPFENLDVRMQRRKEPVIMRIDNSFLSSVSTPSARSAPVSQDAGLRLVAQTAAAADPGAHVPSPQAQQLLQQLAQIPDVRQGRLTEVSIKLASGYYLTPQAASWTAGAILSSGE
jgi:hypothetical protein